MFFRKKKNNNQTTPEIKDEFNKSKDNIDFEDDFKVDFEDDFEVDFEVDFEDDDYKLSPKKIYAINLSLFMNKFEDLNSARDRFLTMIDIGIIDEESFDILEDLTFQVNFCLDSYNSSNNQEDFSIHNLDAQCKNIDYKIRKSLELEKESIEIIKEGFQKEDSELSQNGLDQYTKALNIMEPSINEIKEVLIETETFL
ncbi:MULTISPECIES: hypothetical protein [Mammaliicoccus]|uniref:hypothetical protein n=1 Tax=Mammaliicoccus TaxID=2803850 RepID=UPI001EFAB4CE|nr:MULTISPECIES: hypothetical protein [Mammaliicoccus]MDT0696948.1 hypothetical protein [Mammaliicoccus sciuri]